MHRYNSWQAKCYANELPFLKCTFQFNKFPKLYHFVVYLCRPPWYTLNFIEPLELYFKKTIRIRLRSYKHIEWFER